MEMSFVPCYSDRDLFLGMAKDYVGVLREYDPSIVWDEATWKSAMWNAKYIMEGRTIQGFIMTEEINFKIYRDLLYIEELYIVPEERGRGVGFAAVKKAVENWDGDVFLYILERNFNAKLFWMDVERGLGWKRIERPEVKKERGCELRVFSVS